jgi:hypothetical protein
VRVTYGQRIKETGRQTNRLTDGYTDRDSKKWNKIKVIDKVNCGVEVSIFEP